MAKRIITISREFGSGGRFIGEEVAKKLGIAYYDKNIISQIAEKSGLAPEYIQESAELSPKKGLFAYALAGRDITGKSVEDPMKMTGRVKLHGIKPILPLEKPSILKRFEMPISVQGKMLQKKISSDSFV